MIRASPGVRIASLLVAVDMLIQLVDIPVQNLACRVTGISFLVIFMATMAGSNVELVRPSFGIPPPASVSPAFAGFGCRPAAEVMHECQGKYEPIAGPAFQVVREEPPMPGKHWLKSLRAEHAARHRAVELVDARTLTAHLLTDAAIAAGQLAKGRYIALCGQDVLPASLAEPGRSRFPSCIWIPSQRSRSL